MTLRWVLFTNVYVGVLYRPYNMRCAYLPLAWIFIFPNPSCRPGRVWIAIEWRSNVDAVLMTLLTAHLYPSAYGFKCWCCADDASVSSHLRKKVTCTVQLSLCVPPLDVEILPTITLVAVQAVFYSDRMRIMLVITLLSQASNSWGWAGCLPCFSKSI